MTHPLPQDDEAMPEGIGPEAEAEAAGEDELLAEPGETLAFTVPVLAARERLDQFLAVHLRDCSRSFVQKLIRAGAVLLNGSEAKASKAVSGGESIEITFPQAEAEPAAVPEDIPVPIIFEDAHILVVNKPAGMPTHPSCGHARGTLANAMAFHCGGQLSSVNGPVRPGIVHRLDMDTSGLLLVAKNDPAHRELGRQFAAREVKKTYLALTHGHMRPPAGAIDRELGRHPVKRKQQAVLRSGGRKALTEYKTLEAFTSPRPAAPFSYLELHPHTGRTHQIRVHLASSGCPILCDGLYGRELEFPAAAPVIRRQALHAAEIRFTHPATGAPVAFSAAPPRDFSEALSMLRTMGGN